MKIARKHKVPKKPIIIIAALLFLGGIGGGYFYQSQQPNSSDSSTEIRPQNTVDYSAPSDTEQQQIENTKTAIINKNEQAQGSGSTSSDIIVTLSRANQGGDGLPLNIRTIITGTTSGNCDVTLTQDGQPTINRSFPVIDEATYATCQQADIAAADFSADGEWQLSIIVTSDSGSSQPLIENVDITR